MSLADDDGLRRALEAAGVALATFDREGHALSANMAFAQIFDTTPDGLIGRHLIGLCESAQAPALTSALVRIIGRVSDAEVVDVAPAGHALAEIRLTLALTPPRRNGEELIFCIAGDPDANSHGGLQPQPHHISGDARSLDDSLIAGVVDAINDSESKDRPFAVLSCQFGFSSDSYMVHDNAADERDTESDTEVHGHGTPSSQSDLSTSPVTAPMDPEVARIAISRMDQRLRNTDSIALDASGRVHVIAEDLNDEQDAAGVAYRLLSTMVEPFAVQGERRYGHLTIGIVVADGRNDASSVIDASITALADAVGHGVGGFSIVDLRADHYDPL